MMMVLPSASQTRRSRALGVFCALNGLGYLVALSIASVLPHEDFGVSHLLAATLLLAGGIGSLLCGISLLSRLRPTTIDHKEAAVPYSFGVYRVAAADVVSVWVLNEQGDIFVPHLRTAQGDDIRLHWLNRMSEEKALEVAAEVAVILGLDPPSGSRTSLSAQLGLTSPPARRLQERIRSRRGD